MSGIRRPSSESLRELAVGTLVWAAGAVYSWLHLRSGWIAHDEGTIGQSAVRVLAGELPHADFDAMYTGGLALFHAAVFEIGDVDLVAPRLALWGALLLWLPVVFWIARRFAGPLVASVATLVAVTWSIPNYPAAMPSWYNLFLATFGTGCLLRYLDTSRRRWLLLAGACGGVSVLFKITGVYFLAAAGLFLIAVEQSDTAEDTTEEASRDGAGPVAYRLVLGALGLGCTAALTLLASGTGGARSLFYFALPVAVVVLLLGWRDRWAGSAGSRDRLGRLSRTAAPFVLGAVVPIGLFLLPYVAGGHLDELYRGVFVIPRRRLAEAVMYMPGPKDWGPALVAASPFVLGGLASPKWRRILALIVAVAGAWIVLNGSDDAVYRSMWTSIRPLIPLVVLGGAALLARRSAEREDGGTDRRDLAGFLMVAVLAMTSLIQFPFSAPIYFMYVGPLLVLALLGIVRLLPASTSMRPLVVGFLAAHMLFAARWLNTGFIRGMGLSYRPTPQVAELELPRGGLFVASSEKSQYERLVKLLERVAPDETIYAGPDCPEVYFLSGHRNPTRALFDFLSVDDLRGDALLETLEEHDVRAVVVNRNPSFSDRLDERTLAALERRHDHTAVIGKFIVWW